MMFLLHQGQVMLLEKVKVKEKEVLPLKMYLHFELSFQKLEE